MFHLNEVLELKLYFTWIVLVFISEVHWEKLIGLGTIN